MLICHRTNFIQKTTFIFKWQGQILYEIYAMGMDFLCKTTHRHLIHNLILFYEVFFIVYLAPNLNIYISNKNWRAENLCTKWRLQHWVFKLQLSPFYIAVRSQLQLFPPVLPQKCHRRTTEKQQQKKPKPQKSRGNPDWKGSTLGLRRWLSP